MEKHLALNENHFLITLEHSRHGKNGFNFVAAFVNNKFIELDLTNSQHPSDKTRSYYQNEAIDNDYPI